MMKHLFKTAAALMALSTLTLSGPLTQESRANSEQAAIKRYRMIYGSQIGGEVLPCG